MKLINCIRSSFMCMVMLSGCNGPVPHHYQGYVEGENIYLASPFSGILQKACVARGEVVKKGALLFQLDANPQAIEIKDAAAALLQANQILRDMELPKRPPEIDAILAQIAQTNAQLALANIRVKRNQELYNRHVLAKDDLDAAIEHSQDTSALKSMYEANLALAKLGSRDDQIKAQKAQVASFAAKLAQSKWSLTQKTLYAPGDGVIFDTYFKEGEFVDATKPIASLLTPQNMRIEFFVPPSGLGYLALGQSIAFTCDACASNNSAVINYISPEAEYVPPLVYSRDNQYNLVFRIKAVIHNAALFKPGQPVIVTVTNHG